MFSATKVKSPQAKKNDKIELGQHLRDDFRGCSEFSVELSRYSFPANNLLPQDGLKLEFESGKHAEYARNYLRTHLSSNKNDIDFVDKTLTISQRAAESLLEFYQLLKQLERDGYATKKNKVAGVPASRVAETVSSTVRLDVSANASVKSQAGLVSVSTEQQKSAVSASKKLKKPKHKGSPERGYQVSADASRQANKTNVSVMSLEDKRIFEDFQKYYGARAQQKSQYTRWSCLECFFTPAEREGKNRAVKLSAAQKCMNILSGKQVEEFTAAERYALNDGRLGEIYADHKETIEYVKDLAVINTTQQKRNLG